MTNKIDNEDKEQNTFKPAKTQIAYSVYQTALVMGVAAIATAAFAFFGVPLLIAGGIAASAVALGLGIKKAISVYKKRESKTLNNKKYSKLNSPFDSQAEIQIDVSPEKQSEIRTLFNQSEVIPQLTEKEIEEAELASLKELSPEQRKEHDVRKEKLETRNQQIKQIKEKRNSVAKHTEENNNFIDSENTNTKNTNQVNPDNSWNETAVSADEEIFDQDAQGKTKHIVNNKASRVKELLSDNKSTVEILQKNVSQSLNPKSKSPLPTKLNDKTKETERELN